MLVNKKQTKLYIKSVNPNITRVSDTFLQFLDASIRIDIQRIVYGYHFKTLDDRVFLGIKPRKD